MGFSDMIDIQSWYQGKAPASVFSGDIFNFDWRIYTAQSLVFNTASLELKIFFDTGTPRGSLPLKPVYERVTVRFEKEGRLP